MENEEMERIAKTLYDYVKNPKQDFEECPFGTGSCDNCDLFFGDEFAQYEDCPCRYFGSTEKAIKATWERLAVYGYKQKGVVMEMCRIAKILYDYVSKADMDFTKCPFGPLGDCSPCDRFFSEGGFTEYSVCPCVYFGSTGNAIEETWERLASYGYQKEGKANGK